MIIEELKDSIEKYFKELTENIQIFKEEGKNEKWTKIEILGHLVDSAINNLQRIIRSSYEETPYYAEYDQDKWVDIQQYRKANIENTIDLWYTLNKHLIWTVEHLDVEFSKSINFSNKKQFSLEYILNDYILHMHHHMKQIFANHP